MDWWEVHDWQAWLVIGLLMAGAELLVGDFTLLMLAAAAFVAGLSAAVGANVLVQVLVFAVASVATLGLIRPSIAKRLHAGPTLQSGPESLPGTTGLVLERVDLHNGRVKLRGEVWSARAASATMVVDPGHHVRVVEVDGATAVVEPTD